MAVNVRISLNEKLYLKDPQDSKLGRRIIQYSVLLIDELGFETFNFKKLAKHIKSTEASIYRYFENKHSLLIYLVSWYWEWISYLLSIKMLNVEDSHKKLAIIIHTFVYASIENSAIDYINQTALHNIVVAESTKAYHTKEVDNENKKGFFLNYKNLVATVAKVFLEINPQFSYPSTLASNLFEMTNNHIYFADHLPQLTDIKKEGDKYKAIEQMLHFFVTKLLKP